MKILIISFTYWPNRDGVQNVTQYQAEWLVKMGHQVTVITSDDHNKLCKEDHNGVRVIRLPIYKKGFFISGEKEYAHSRIIEECNKHDVLVSISIQSFLNRCILRDIDKIECPKVGVLHGIHEFGYTKIDFTSLKGFLKKTAQNIFWTYFYHSDWKYIAKYNAVTHLHEKDYSLQFYEEHGYHNNYVIYNAAQDDFFKQVEKKNFIINIGRFSQLKNQIKCLDVFWKANTDGYKLVLIGPEKNTYYDKLLKHKEKLETKYGHKEVEILADISREETINYILQSKIYLMTSTREAFPVSIIEAMASGAAFVGTDVGIVKYLPGGEVCSNYKDIPQKLNKVIAEYDSYSTRAQEYAYNNFRQEEQVKKLEKIVYQAIEDNNNESSFCK